MKDKRKSFQPPPQKHAKMLQKTSKNVANKNQKKNKSKIPI